MDLDLLRAQIDRAIEVLPPSIERPDRSLAVLMHAKSEELASQAVAALKKSGFTELRITSTRTLLFQKRWEVVGRSAPVRFTSADLNRWLDSVYALSQSTGVSLETWAPLALSNEEL
jgi:hypothetical protein